MDIARMISLAPNEDIIRAVRMSYGAWYRKFLGGFLIIALGAFFALPVIRVGWWAQVVWDIGMVIGCLLIIRTYVIARGNKYIITSRRIVSLRRTGLFHRAVEELSLPKVIDTGYTTQGIMQTLFRAGSVKCTISSGVFVLEWVRYPADIQRLIVDAIDTLGNPPGGNTQPTPPPTTAKPPRRLPPVPPTPYAVREDVSTVLQNAFRKDA